MRMSFVKVVGYCYFNETSTMDIDFEFFQEFSITQPQLHLDRPNFMPIDTNQRVNAIIILKPLTLLGVKMSAVAWSDKLSVGISQVDTEHQNLVGILNQLDEAMRTGKGTRVMGDILMQLIDYTHIHFENEEKLMAEANFPKLERHKTQHRQLMEKVEKFYQKFTTQGKRITKEMMEFLRYWLTNHILVDDMAFGKHCVGQTV